MRIEGGFGRRVLAGFAVLLVLLVVSAAAAIFALRDVAATQAAITRRTIRTAVSIQELRYAVERRVLAARGYLLTRDLQYLDELRRAHADFDTRIEALRQDVDLRGEPTRGPLASILTELEWSAAAMTDAFDELAGQAQSGSTDGAIRATIEQRLLPIAARMQDQVSHLAEIQEAEVRDASARSADAAARARALTVGIAGISVLLGAMLGWVLTRTLTRAYRQAQDAATRLRLVLDTVADGIFGVDGDGRCTFANRACVATLGVEGEEALLGRDVREIVHRAVAGDEDDCGAHQALATGRPVHRYDQTLVRRDGTVVPVEAAAVPVLTDRRVTGAVVTFHDVSERKRLEDLRRETETMRLREEALAMASHDLKSPLAAAKLNIESLLRATLAGNLEPAKATEKLRSADRILDGMAYGIRDLLTSARLGEGGVTLDRRETDLAAIAREVIDKLGEVARHAGCEVALHAPEPVTGVWDRSYLEHAVANLLSNALKFGKGKPVDVAVRGEDGAGRLSVRDHGPGIAPEERVMLFERYQQTEAGRKASGHGLGLWITRRVVEMHGGTVSVESQPGEGATFTIRLPRGSA